ncbi:MAG: DUF192 domain-containing protein [Bdellovibrionaceae bacterium]|nr:DUF192 domain-containing protein [Pseudobdellovibrionaceae bacterium]MBX3033706.1 DUF192 domain-containing protein [Pseudobdellovibrionaceae bacterium]
MAWLWSFVLALEILLALPSTTFAREVQFEKQTLRIGSRAITVEIARTEAQHQRGLMFRRSLKDDEGMLFVFNREETRSFWMKNTFIDLAIGYFDRDKTLIDIQEMKSVDSVMATQPPSYQSKAPAQYALEVPKGWFERHKIRKGARFTLD